MRRKLRAAGGTADRELDICPHSNVTSCAWGLISTGDRFPGRDPGRRVGVCPRECATLQHPGSSLKGIHGVHVSISRRLSISVKEAKPAGDVTDTEPAGRLTEGTADGRRGLLRGLTFGNCETQVRNVQLDG